METETDWTDDGDVCYGWEQTRTEGTENVENDTNETRILIIPHVDEFEQVMHRVALECVELNSRSDLWLKWEHGSHENLHITMGISMDLTHLSTDQKNIIGLSAKYIVIRLALSKRTYWTEQPEVESITLSDSQASGLTFSFSWAIRHRLRTKWIPAILSQVSTYVLPQCTPSDIETVMEITSSSFHDAIDALTVSKCSVMDAVKLLEHCRNKTVPRKHSNMNVYIDIANHVSSYVKSAHQTCIVCDKKLQCVGFRPSVCDNDLCCYGFENFGFGFDMNTEIMKNTLVFDLLISLFISASQRKKLDFVNFSKDGISMDHTEIQQILETSCPSVFEMREMVMNGINVTEKLNELNSKLYAILRWLIISTRSYICELPPEKQISSMGTSHQFMLMTDTPEREEQFQKIKRSESSVYYAFHGSPTWCWYSILRVGLKNMSGTKYMTTGAVFGNGVYLAEHSSTSASYIKTDQSVGWSSSIFRTGFRCMAVCEVVGTPIDKSGSGIYVVPDEERIAARYLMIYPPETHIPNVSAQTLFNLQSR